MHTSSSTSVSTGQPLKYFIGLKCYFCSVVKCNYYRLNTELLIAKRIIFGRNRESRFSKPIVRIAIIGIALGIAVMILTLAIVTGFQSEIRDKVIGFGAHIQIFNYDSNTSQEPNPIDKDQEFLPLLRSNPGIRHIQMYAIKHGLIKTKTDNEDVLLKGIGPDHDWKFIESNLIDGKVFKAGEPVAVDSTGTARNPIVISKTLAKRLGLHVDSKLNIYFLITKVNEHGEMQRPEGKGRPFYVTGIYETGFGEFDQKTVFVDIDIIRKLNSWEGDQVGGYEVLISDYEKLDEMGQFVYDNIGQEMNSQTVKQSHSTIFSWLDLMDWNAIIVIVLMVAVASINMISALLVLILERTNMIGILKALGASNLSIRRVFLYNAAYLIGVGLLWGNIFGLLICFVQEKYGLFTLAQETYYLSEVPINLELTHVLLLNAATMVMCVLMLILPSFIVTRITPVKAIRFS
jgi:lipoprotein-releasing system permease protein